MSTAIVVILSISLAVHSKHFRSNVEHATHQYAYHSSMPYENTIGTTTSPLPDAISMQQQGGQPLIRTLLQTPCGNYNAIVWVLPSEFKELCHHAATIHGWQLQQNQCDESRYILMTEHKTQLESFQKTVAEQNATINELKTRLAAQDARIKELVPQIAEYEIQLEGLQKTVAEQNATNNELKTRLAARDARIKELEPQIADYKTQLENQAQLHTIEHILSLPFLDGSSAKICELKEQIKTEIRTKIGDQGIESKLLIKNAIEFTLDPTQNREQINKLLRSYLFIISVENVNTYMAIIKQKQEQNVDGVDGGARIRKKYSVGEWSDKNAVIAFKEQINIINDVVLLPTIRAYKLEIENQMREKMKKMEMFCSSFHDLLISNTIECSINPNPPESDREEINRLLKQYLIIMFIEDAKTYIEIITLSQTRAVDGSAKPNQPRISRNILNDILELNLQQEVFINEYNRVFYDGCAYVKP